VVSHLMAIRGVHVSSFGVRYPERIPGCVEVPPEPETVCRDVDDVLDEFRSWPTYLSVDASVLDPSYGPSAWPAAGGWSADELLKTVRLVSQRTNVIGFDFVELCATNVSNPSPAGLTMARALLDVVLWKMGGDA
jgi:arginase family enzyme